MTDDDEKKANNNNNLQKSMSAFLENYQVNKVFTELNYYYTTGNDGKEFYEVLELFNKKKLIFNIGLFINVDIFDIGHKTGRSDKRRRC